MQKFLLALCLTFCTGSVFAYGAKGLRHTFYYVGLNSGASIAHFQGTDNYSDTEDQPQLPPPPPPPYTAHHKNEVSARGYNGGLFFGYNFYCCGDLVLGLELSGDLYSNRGYYTINYWNPNNNAYSGFEFSFDVDFSLHTTLRPQFFINDDNLVFAQIGLAYADINVRAANLIASNVGNNINPVNSREATWGLTLGVGIQHRASCHISTFASYEYTRYRNICLKDVVQASQGDDVVFGAFTNRDAFVDTNLFKMGMIFTF